MVVALYIEVNIVCILILGTMLVKIGTSVYSKKHQILFSAELIMFSLLFISDCVRNMIDNKLIHASVAAHYFSNLVYFCLGSIITMLWLIYTLSRISHPLFHSKTGHGIMCIPCLIMIVLSVTSFTNHWLFSINESNNMVKGPLWPVYVTVCSLYGVAASIFTFMALLNKANAGNRSLYISLAIFPYFPIAAIASQAIFNSFPITCVGVSIPLLVYFYKMLESECLADKDTLLFNKNWLYLTHENISKKDEINDQYLMLVIAGNADKIDSARELTPDEIFVAARFLDNLNGTISGIRNISTVRFSNSSFVLLIDSESEDSVKTLAGYIKKEASKLEASQDKNTIISLTPGYQPYTKDVTYIQDLINEIDESLISTRI